MPHPQIMVKNYVPFRKDTNKHMLSQRANLQKIIEVGVEL